MTAPRVALIGMILESHRFARPADRRDFEDLYWPEGARLLDEARASAPLIAPECAAVWTMCRASSRRH